MMLNGELGTLFYLLVVIMRTLEIFNQIYDVLRSGKVVLKSRNLDIQNTQGIRLP